MKLLLAFILSQALVVSPPQQTAALTLPGGALYVTAIVRPLPILIPGQPSPGWHQPLPSHLPSTPWFDGHARAALIVQTPTGYRVIVMGANGQHVAQDFSDQTNTIDTSMK